MTTALTPIITQLELDRDRFKVLINGTVDDTVQLEFRVEKSIAGQIRDRIDGLALDLITAVDNAQMFANNAQMAATNAADSVSDAQAAQLAAEAARDAALTAQGASETARNESSDYAGEAQTFRNEAEAFSRMLSKASASELYLKMIHPVYSPPTEVLEVSPSNFSLIGQPFDSNSDRVRFESRRFEMLDLGTTIHEDALDIQTQIESLSATVVIDSTSTELEHYIGTQADSGNFYAARFTDTFVQLDEPSKSSAQNKRDIHVSSWSVFKFNNTLTHISRPTVATTDSLTATKLTPTFTVSAPTVTGTGSVDSTYFRVVDENGKVVHDELAAGIVDSFSIPHGKLSNNATYRASAQFIINTSDLLEPTTPPIVSPFGASVEFTTEEVNSHIPFYQTRSVVTTSTIDVENAAVHRVNAAANKTLTLSKTTLPSNVAQNIVVFIEDSGGVITWPTEVSWAGGNEPTLGTTWTLVNLFWTGSMWIGMEGSKR